MTDRTPDAVDEAAPRTRPVVVFVCVKNGGKSQMAAALARVRAGDALEVHSAGTSPGSSLNEESRASIERVGATFDGEEPKPLTEEIRRRVDRIVVVGEEARVEPLPGESAPVEVWAVDEPSLRGIEGPERMDLIRDELDARVRRLLAELGLS